MATENKKLTQSEANAMIAGGTFLAAVATPVIAMADDPSTQVASTVTALGTITTAATTVVVGALAVRLAIKMVNRLTVKG